MNELIAAGVAVGRLDERATQPFPPRFRLRLEIPGSRPRELVWAGGRLTIGSSAEADVCLEGRGIAPLHCEIVAEGQELVLRDPGARGTWIGGVRVREALLPRRASLRVGDVTLSLAVLDAAEGDTAALGRLVGRSQVMRDVIARLRSIAARDATLLLEGQSGTGKEVAAEAVHASSARCHKPFVVVDCGAIARSLIEAELFGHERGAYTGATHARAGALARAEGGTLFLDEIGELDLELQPRLLRLIERREAKPLGGATTRRLDVRIIAATNRDLCREAARGSFRTDLYYRLAVTCVRLPSLAERPEDIPLLSRLFAEELGERGLEHSLDDAALGRLAARPWPGNVRELRNAIERLATFGAEGNETQAPVASPSEPRGPRGSYHDAKARLLATFERQFLTDVLAEHGGNITAAAHASAVDRVHFLRLLDRHQLRKPR